MNIEHQIERESDLVTIVVSPECTRARMHALIIARRAGVSRDCPSGDAGLMDSANLVYVAMSGSFGASLTYGKAVLGLLIAWALNYL